MFNALPDMLGLDRCFIFGYQIILTTLLAGLLGLERERKGQAAGLRTHIILTLGALLAMNLSFYLTDIYPNITLDRIPAQVISGIGFLGAGAILRFGVSIKGLTTAAGLWSSAIIGLAVGAGFYVPAALIALVIFVVITLLDSIEKKMSHIKHSIIVNLEFKNNNITVQKILDHFKDFEVNFHEVEYLDRPEKTRHSLDFRLSLFKSFQVDSIIDDLRQWDGIEKIRVKIE